MVAAKQFDVWGLSRAASLSVPPALRPADLL